MDLLPSPDQQAVVDAVAEMLSERVPLDVARSYDPASGRPPGWEELAAMGFFGLGLLEEAGGAGLGLAEQALAFVEVGRHLVPGPVLGTALAAQLAAEAGVSDLAESFITGSASAGIAPALAGVDGDRGAAGAGWLRAYDAEGASHLLVIGRRGAALFDITDLDAVACPSLDPYVSLSELDVGSASAVASDPSPVTWWRATLLIASAQVGVAEAALGDAVSYASVREQFGQIIGGFQAVKHRCAEMATRAEVARFQVAYASLAGPAGSPTSAPNIAAARLVAGDAARLNAADNILVHGAMGFSDESVAHLYARRAEAWEVMAGVARWSAEFLAEGDGVPTAH